MCSFNVHEQTSTNSHKKRLRRGNQINWQYWAQKTEDEDKQSKKQNIKNEQHGFHINCR